MPLSFTPTKSRKQAGGGRQIAGLVAVLVVFGVLAFALATPATASDLLHGNPAAGLLAPLSESVKSSVEASGGTAAIVARREAATAAVAAGMPVARANLDAETLAEFDAKKWNVVVPCRSTASQFESLAAQVDAALDVAPTLCGAHNQALDPKVCTGLKSFFADLLFRANLSGLSIRVCDQH